jgi:hypothetical protein
MKNVRFAGQFLCSYSTLPVYALVTQVTHICFRLDVFSDEFISISSSFEMLEMHQYVREEVIMHLC